MLYQIVHYIKLFCTLDKSQCYSPFLPLYPHSVGGTHTCGMYSASHHALHGGVGYGGPYAMVIIAVTVIVTIDELNSSFRDVIESMFLIIARFLVSITSRNLLLTSSMFNDHNHNAYSVHKHGVKFTTDYTLHTLCAKQRVHVEIVQHT